jgi:hypothetical protein
MTDPEWLSNLAAAAQQAPTDPRVNCAHLADYADALRFCRIYKLQLETGHPLSDSITGFLKPRRSRCVAQWLDVPSGIMAFCGIFSCRTRRFSPEFFSRLLELGRRTANSLCHRGRYPRTSSVLPRRDQNCARLSSPQRRTAKQLGDILMFATPKRPGISETTLTAAGIRLSDYPEPGSIEITYCDETGDPTRFKRWRRPEPCLNGKYYQEPGTGVHAYYPPFHFPHHHVADLGLAEHSVVLLEGEFKTLSLNECGIYAIGIPSFIVYTKDQNGYRRLLDDLRRIFDHEAITTIYFVGDSDTCTNFEFSRNAAFLARNAWKAQVMLPRIPFGGPKGLDDCKAKMGDQFCDFFAQLVRDAVPLDRKCDETSLALILLARESVAIKALTGFEAEKQYSRIVRLVAAAQALAETATTARLRAFAADLIGITREDLKKAIKTEHARRGREKSKEKPKEQPKPQASKPDLILPGHHVEFIECGKHCFQALATEGRYFVRDRIVFELVKDDDGARLVELEPEAFRSHLEKYFRLQTFLKHKDQLLSAEGRCSVADATALLKSDPAWQLLSPINAVTTAAVFAEANSKLAVLEEGYHASLGGIYVARKHDIVIVQLDEAVNSLLALARDFLFVTPSDKSRFFAGLISPALRMGGLLKADFPLQINEADQSQSGKSYAHKMLCLLFGERAHVVLKNEEKMAIGSLAEQVSEGLIAGRIFIVFENIRGAIALSMLESAIRGNERVPCRVAYSRGTQVRPDRVCWLLSSNKAQTTSDLANRSIITRLRKQPPDHKFAAYAEGDLLAHVESKCDYYLSCLLAILSEWHRQGKPRTNESRHDFREWCQTLDWIVRNVLKLPPLLDGHQHEQKRISNPLLSWLRDLANCVQDAKKVGEGLRSAELAQICADESLEIPQCRANADGDERAMVIGKIMKRLFKDETTLIVGGWSVGRQSWEEYDSVDRHKKVRYYHTFERINGESEK